MRKLIILRGAMGCGKSTFIKEHNLEKFTLSSDNLRLMLNAPQMTLNYSEEIPQFNNQKVWDLLFYFLEERMKKGEFTIIDAVHAQSKNLSLYKKLAEKYRYRLYILDFTDIPVEEIYKRNTLREPYKIVPQKDIDRVSLLFSKEKIPSSFQIIKPENFSEIVTNSPRNFDTYEKIHIFGDIHGCISPLQEYFTNHPFNDCDAYIFLGDYFDRGLQNFKTFTFLNNLSINKNVILLLGNHEDKLYKYACDDEFKMDYDIKNTIKEFEQNNLSKSEIRGFIKKLSQIVYLQFGPHTYLISHGGIPYFPTVSLDFYSTNSFIYGIDKYDVNIDQVYHEFMLTSQNKIFQIHGHRNFNQIKYNEFPYSLNLEGNIEHGGHLRILTLTKNGQHNYNEILNKTYNPNLIAETNVYNLLANLRNNKYIFERPLENNISSFNFTKEAFYHKIWNDITTEARSLFIDTENYQILARSYNKFFKINEREETKLEKLADTLNFPVQFYLKYNGFLGILSVNDNELFFATKSTNIGPYVEYFKNIFYQTFTTNQINALKTKITTTNVTIVFEVIDPVNDPHIISYPKPSIILLDMISNSPDFSKIPYSELQTFSKKHKITLKELVYTANNYETFTQIYDKITSPDYKYKNNYIEGFVIEDNNNFMVKTKSFYYNKWKNLRTKMEYALKNNNFSYQKNNPLEQDFLQYLKSKYENQKIDLTSINIISERDEFKNKLSSKD